MEGITYKCKVCSKDIHPKRAQLGYKDTCPIHSTSQRYTGHLVVDGKTDYSIQVIKDIEVAKHLQSLNQSRASYG